MAASHHPWARCSRRLRRGGRPRQRSLLGRARAGRAPAARGGAGTLRRAIGQLERLRRVPAAVGLAALGGGEPREPGYGEAAVGGLSRLPGEVADPRVGLRRRASCRPRARRRPAARVRRGARSPTPSPVRPRPRAPASSRAVSRSPTRRSAGPRYARGRAAAQSAVDASTRARSTRSRAPEVRRRTRARCRGRPWRRAPRGSRGLRELARPPCRDRRSWFSGPKRWDHRLRQRRQGVAGAYGGVAGRQ